MMRCVRCGFVQPDALPLLPNYFDRMYDQQWSAEWIEQEFNSRYKDYIFRTILCNLAKRRKRASGRLKLLDIGAHAGRFISLAQRSGWEAEGIELNPRTSAFAAERTGLTVHRMNASALAEQTRKYTAVTLTDVLEHIPEPLNVLQTAFKLLVPGGCVAIKVPFARNQLIKERVRSFLGLGDMTDKLAMNLVHVSHFSPQSLKLALHKSGFRKITITIGAPELADPQFQPGFRNRFSNFFRRAVYLAARTLPGGVYSPLALNLQAYAERPNETCNRAF